MERSRDKPLQSWRASNVMRGQLGSRAVPAFMGVLFFSLFSWCTKSDVPTTGATPAL